MTNEEQQVYDVFVSSMQEVFFPFTDVDQPDIERAAAIMLERFNALIDKATDLDKPAIEPAYVGGLEVITT